VIKWFAKVNPEIPERVQRVILFVGIGVFAGLGIWMVISGQPG
jgi:hypothetical protein